MNSPPPSPPPRRYATQEGGGGSNSLRERTCDEAGLLLLPPPSLHPYGMESPSFSPLPPPSKRGGVRRVFEGEEGRPSLGHLPAKEFPRPPKVFPRRGPVPHLFIKKDEEQGAPILWQMGSKSNSLRMAFIPPSPYLTPPPPPDPLLPPPMEGGWGDKSWRGW